MAVVYGNEAAALINSSLPTTGSSSEYTVLLQNLQPDTEYYYAVVCADSGRRVTAPLWFRTQPTVGTAVPMRVWVVGDAGTGDQYQVAVRDAFCNLVGIRTVDVWMVLGDNAYNAGMPIVIYNVKVAALGA